MIGGLYLGVESGNAMAALILRVRKDSIKEGEGEGEGEGGGSKGEGERERGGGGGEGEDR